MQEQSRKDLAQVQKEKSEVQKELSEVQKEKSEVQKEKSEVQKEMSEVQKEKSEALNQVIQIQQQLLQLQQENTEIDKQRMEAISHSYPLASRGALETIWADFKDRHDRSSLCSVSLNSATAFFQHWLVCRLVDFHTSDYVLQVQDSSGRTVFSSSQAGVDRELPHMYNTLSSLAHVVLPPSAVSEMIIPKQLTADQACALATILKRHHFQHVYYQS